MKMGKWVLVAAAPLLTCWLSGCGDFWQAPTSGNTSFTLTNSGNLSVTPGASIGNTATITVTPANSFTGTVDLSCAVTPPSGASNPTTCSMSPTSVDISSTSALTSVMTATTSSSTTAGAYQITVTGVSGSVAETTSVCVEVSSSSASCGSSSTTSGVFYVLNETTNQIVVLSISSGALNTIAAYTLPAVLSSTSAIAVAPNDEFLYVNTLNGVYVYTIGSNGVLTLGNSGLSLGFPASAMQVDATDSWLVFADSGSYQLGAVAINPSTGAPAVLNESPEIFPGGLTATTVTQLAISPGDSSSCGNCYVFVGLGTGGMEFISFNPGNVNPFGGHGNPGLKNSAGGDNAVAVDPTNRLLYVGESDALSATQSGGLRVFSIGNTGLTEISGSPYTTGGTGPSSIQPTADGKYVYVANLSVSGSSNDNIAAFSVSTAALTSVGSAVAAGPTGRIGLAQDSTGSFLLAIDFAGNPDLEAYTMSSGTLTSILSVATGTDPVGAVAIAAAP